MLGTVQHFVYPIQYSRSPQLVLALIPRANYHPLPRSLILNDVLARPYLAKSSRK